MPTFIGPEHGNHGGAEGGDGNVSWVAGAGGVEEMKRTRAHYREQKNNRNQAGDLW